jgi:hypothetical protein
MVEYSADFYILKPVDVTKGNGALFYELANRGSAHAVTAVRAVARNNASSSHETARYRLLVAVVRSREHHAGEKRAERHRHARELHEGGGAQHDQQGGRRHHLAGAGAGEPPGATWSRRTDRAGPAISSIPIGRPTHRQRQSAFFQSICFTTVLY